MQSVVTYQQLSFVDAGASLSEWGAVARAAVRVRHRARAMSMSTPVSGECVPRPEYESLLERLQRAESEKEAVVEQLRRAESYIARDRERSRRWHAQRRPETEGDAGRPAPTAQRDAGRPGSFGRPAGHIRRHGAGRPAPQVSASSVQNGPGRPASKEGTIGVLTPDSRCTEIPPISPPVPRRPAGTERVEQFAELVAAEGIPIAMSRADRRAVAACELPPAVVANAVVDVVRGKWGNAWLRENLSVSVVVKKLTAYLNRTQAAARPSPVASSAYSHDPWQGTAPPIDPADLAAFYGAAS